MSRGFLVGLQAPGPQHVQEHSRRGRVAQGGSQEQGAAGAPPLAPASAPVRGPPSSGGQPRRGFATSGLWQQGNIHISTHTVCTPSPNHGSRQLRHDWTRFKRAARSRERNSSPTLWDGDSSLLIWGRFLRSTAHRDNSVHCDRAYAAAWNSRHGSRGLSSGHSH